MLLILVLGFSIQLNANPQRHETLFYNKSFSLSDKSAVLDNFGNLHIFYGTDQLYHASWNGINWEIETVDTGPRVGGQVAAMVDADNHFRIIYTEASFAESPHSIAPNQGHFKYASNVSGQWKIEYLPQELFAWWNYRSDLNAFLDEEQNVHLFIHSFLQISMAMHIHNKAGKWMYNKIDLNHRIETTRHFTKSMGAAQDDEGHFFITVFNASPRCMEVFSNRHNKWEKMTSLPIQTDYPDYTVKMCVDHQNQIHLIFQDGSEVRHAIFRDGEWQTLKVDEISTFKGGFSSLSVNKLNDGTIHLMYIDLDNSVLKSGLFTGEKWIVDLVKTVSDLNFTLSVSSTSENLSYVRIEDGLLLFYENLQGSAEVPILIDKCEKSEIAPGSNPQARMDGLGNMHVTFYQNGALIYACRNSEGEWSSQRIAQHKFEWGRDGELILLDPKENVLRVEVDGTVHIVMTSNYNSKLIKITYKNGVWEKEIISDFIINPENLEFSIDDEGSSFISYFEEVKPWCFPSQRKLTFVSNKKGTWEEDTVSKGETYRSKKMKIVNGEIILAYFEGKNCVVKTAKHSKQGWKIQTLPSLENKFFAMALEIDCDENIHLVGNDLIWSNVPDGISYWINQGGKWKGEKLETKSVFNQLDVWVDNQGDVHVAGYYESNFDIENVGHEYKAVENLYYARKSQNKWKKGIVDGYRKSGIHHCFYNNQEGYLSIIYDDQGSHAIKTVSFLDN